jgi:hypothetical protein
MAIRSVEEELRVGGGPAGLLYVCNKDMKHPIIRLPVPWPHLQMIMTLDILLVDL